MGGPGSHSSALAGNNLLSAAAATHGNNAYSTLSGAASTPHQAAAAASFFPNYIMAAQQAAVAGYGCLSGPGTATLATHFETRTFDQDLSLVKCFPILYLNLWADISIQVSTLKRRRVYSLPTRGIGIN